MNFSKIEVEANKRGYMVTEKGIFLNPEGKEIGHTNEKGYLQTTIRVNTLNVKVRAHRLQAYQKYGNKIYEEGFLVRHKNNNKLDNSSSNILIGSYQENSMDRPKKDRLKYSLHATSFWRKYNKDEVRAFYKTNKSYKKTMEEFGISSKGTLHFILNN